MWMQAPEVITLIIVALEVTLILARPCARARNTAIPTRALRIAPPASIVSSSTEVTLVNLVITLIIVALDCILATVALEGTLIIVALDPKEELDGECSPILATVALGGTLIIAALEGTLIIVALECILATVAITRTPITMTVTSVMISPKILTKQPGFQTPTISIQTPPLLHCTWELQSSKGMQFNFASSLEARY